MSFIRKYLTINVPVIIGNPNTSGGTWINGVNCTMYTFQAATAYGATAVTYNYDTASNYPTRYWNGSTTSVFPEFSAYKGQTGAINTASFAKLYNGTMITGLGSKPWVNYMFTGANTHELTKSINLLNPGDLIFKAEDDAVASNRIRTGFNYPTISNMGIIRSKMYETFYPYLYKSIPRNVKYSVGSLAISLNTLLNSNLTILMFGIKVDAGITSSANYIQPQTNISAILLDKCTISTPSLINPNNVGNTIMPISNAYSDYLNNTSIMDLNDYTDIGFLIADSNEYFIEPLVGNEFKYSFDFLT